jgi:predicted RNA binding protein YcfA (HicA-like mRNA interferase family)
VEWSSTDVVTVIESLGFSRDRREAHDTYTRPDHPRVVSVPRNRASIPPGTLSSIWRQAGITAAAAAGIRQPKKKSKSQK